MNTTTFVTCSETSCPMNSFKTCRAKNLEAGSGGECLSFSKDGEKSQTDNYVEIDCCACQKCDQWELDEATNRGKCGTSEPLHFSRVEVGEKEPPKPPLCMAFKTQIGQPGFVANV